MEEEEEAEEEEEERNDLYPSGAKILPRVLVPPVEHPDGKRVGMAHGAVARKGCLRSSYRCVYNFRWGLQLVGNTARLPFALGVVGTCCGGILTTDVYAGDTTHCSPKAH